MLRNLAEAITVVDDAGRPFSRTRRRSTSWDLNPPRNSRDAKPGEIMSRFIVLGESGEELDLDAMPARRLFRGEQAPPLLVRNIVRATGEERWVIVRASPIADPETGRMAYAANVFEDVTEVKRAQLAEAFMAQASRVLASSLDYGETLQRVARLAAGELADWCAVDVLGERGRARTRGRLSRRPGAAGTRRTARQAATGRRSMKRRRPRRDPYRRSAHLQRHHRRGAGYVCPQRRASAAAARRWARVT